MTIGVRERINITGSPGDGKVTTAKLADGAVTAAKVAADAVEAGDLAADSIPDSAAIVKIISPNAFDEAALLDVIADNAITEAVVDALFAAGAIDASDRLKAASVGDDRLTSFLVKEPGRIANGILDFAGVATAGATVTIGAATYLEDDAPTVTNGEWTNGSTANNSAVSLAAAINGDTRNSGGPSYAAIVKADSVFVFALAVGVGGNVSMSVSTGEPASIENLIGGAAAAVKQQVLIQHVITALEVAVASSAPEVLIPLPFDPAFFTWTVYDSSGGIYATEMTGQGSVVNAASPIPAYFLLANNGSADVQAGDIIRLVVQD